MIIIIVNNATHVKRIGIRAQWPANRKALSPKGKADRYRGACPGA